MMKLQDHEKFIAFVLLGAALTGFGMLIYLHPLVDSSANSGVLQILNMIIGALIGGFGAAVSQLLKASSDTVKIDNKPSEPVPTSDVPTAEPATATTEELPDYAK